jgi:heme/copper-type cytochrome/quinol oxidase subunit 2
MNRPLAETIFWIAVAACVVAEFMILRSTFAFRRATKSEVVPASSRTSELALAIVPVIALSVVFFATWQRVEAHHGHMTIDHSQMNHTMPMPPAGGADTTR